MKRQNKRMSILFLSGILSFSIVLFLSVCIGSAEEIKRVSDSSTSMGVGTYPEVDVHKVNTHESEIETFDNNTPVLDEHSGIAEPVTLEDTLTDSNSEIFDTKSQATEEKLKKDKILLVFGYLNIIGGVAFFGNIETNKSILQIQNLR